MTSSTKVTSSTTSDRNRWVWGFSPQIELWSGRLAMVGFVSALLIKLFSDQGILHF